MEVPAPAGDGREGPPQRALVGAGDELSVLRGLRYIRDLGSSLLANPRTRERYGSDLLLPFFLTARVSPGAAPAERMALDVARHLALAWRATAAPASPAVVQAGSPRVLRDLAQGLYSLRMLGLPAPGLLAQLRERVAAVPAAEVLLFDPGRERAPHLQLFDPCSCGAYTHPRAPDCLCGHRLHARPRFDVLLDALVYAFHFERMALPAGVCYFEVLRQLCDEYARATSSIAAAAAAATTTPGAKPRAAATRARARLDSEVEEVDRQRDAHYLFYAVTHLVYTLNGFDQTHLGPGLLPATALGYLGAELECAMAADDPDRTAEAIVALRALLPLTPDALLPPDASAPNSLLPDSRGADSSAPADGPTARREERDQAGAGRAHDQPLADPSKSALGALQAQLGRGVAYLRRAQSADGGWAVAAAGGEGEELDLFSRYHAALVAVAALRETHYQIASRQVQQGAVGGQPAVPLSTDVVGGPPDAVSQPAGSVGGEPAPTRAEWSGVVFAGLRESASGGRAVLRAWLQPQGSCAQPHRSHHSSEEQARSPGAHANNGPLARDTGDTEAGRGNAECVECAGDTADTQQRAEASNTQRQRGCTCGIANPLVTKNDLY
ncbi:hypothetical protein T492DRAFT_242797 [Pavlovales sp. CCMP2436]|nr:hypothetical protein T492DRAFT_242797 [Pavlovales sp. CCMP2436]